jgi:hypothetical protein
MNRILLALLILATFGCATLKPNPTQSEADRTRKTAVIVMNTITTALGIYDQILATAEVQEQAGQLSPQALRDFATLGKQFASVSDQALTALGKVTSMPSLNTTVAFVVSQLQPLIVRLDNSGKDTYRAFSLALRVCLDLLNQYAVTGHPEPLGVYAWQ